MQPLAPSVVAVAVVIPHPPHNGDSSSATQPHHPRVCSPITHEELALATRGELEIQRVNDVLHHSALGLHPAQCSPSPGLVSCRETWRPYVPHFLFATTHRTVIVEDRRLRLTQLSSPGIARHGMASGWGRSGDARGDFCLGFTVHCGNFVVVMAKHDGLFSYVNRACGSLVMSCEVSAASCE
jgi:hypothetical protein